MQEAASLIANEDPNILFDALRKNGHWVYSVSTADLEDHIKDTEHENMCPITVDDFNEAFDNNWNVYDAINEQEVVSQMINDIKHARFDKQIRNEKE